MIEMIGKIQGLMDLGSNRVKAGGGMGEGGGFGGELTRALKKVNEMDLKGNELIQRMVVDPGKVSVHEVMHGLSQAELGLSMTKAVTERVINAYRELVNLR